MSYCEFYTQDWIVAIGTLTFITGVVSTLGCTYIQDSPCEEQLKSLTEKIDSMHKMYHTDLMTLLRETLNPTTPASPRDPVQWDNNSIPGGA